MRNWIYLFVLPFCLNAHSYFGEVPEAISAKVIKKSTELTLKDHGEMEVEISYPKEFQVKEIALNTDNSSDMHYQLQNQESTVSGDEGLVQKFSLRYEPQVEGTHALELPLIHFESKNDPTRKHTLYPPSIECEVRMTAEDPMDELEVAAPLTLDEAPPIELDSYNRKVFFQKSEEDLKEVHQKLLSDAPSMKWKWFVYALILGFVAYKLYQLMSRKKSFKELFMTREDPRERALRALKNLRTKNLPKKGRFSDFYVEITQIIREYIEGHYNIKAPEQTTQEFLQIVLNESVFTEEINHYLTEFLKFADLVKFAKLSPQVEDCRQAETAAEKFILGEDQTQQESQNQSVLNKS